MPGNAIVYCRVSSERQANEGHGLDGQERRCREYAAANGYRVLQVFRDEGASGGTIDRPALKELFAFLATHRDVDLVLFEDVSRIARDMGVHIQVLSEITRLGAKYQTVNQPIEDTAVGKFIVQSLANVAELHRNLNAQNVKNRMKARLAAGYWTFDYPPGYRYGTVTGHGRLLVRDEPKASIIKEALEGFACGRFPSQAAVQEFLQSRGFTHRGSGEVVHPEQVRRILSRILYTGYVEYLLWGIPLTKGHHESLISMETFEKIEKRLARAVEIPQDRRDMRNDFPLRGFVLCSGCGKCYTASWSRGRNRSFGYYRCDQDDCPHYGKSVRAETLHDKFEVMLQDIQPRPELLELVRTALLDLWGTRRLDVQSLLEAREREQASINAKIKRYTDLIGEAKSRSVITAYEQKLEELENQKLRLGSRIAVDQDNLESYDFGTALRVVFDFIKNPYRMWKSGNLARKRLVLRLVFKEPLVFDRETGFGTASLSLPVEIACVAGGSREKMVDMLGKSWNRLRALIMDWYAQLQAVREAG
jgi:DNA invertase Pin-like site-specific DNA recombinase